VRRRRRCPPGHTSLSTATAEVWMGTRGNFQSHFRSSFALRFRDSLTLPVQSTHLHSQVPPTLLVTIHSPIHSSRTLTPPSPNPHHFPQPLVVLLPPTAKAPHSKSAPTRGLKSPAGPVLASAWTGLREAVQASPRPTGRQVTCITTPKKRKDRKERKEKAFRSRHLLLFLLRLLLAFRSLSSPQPTPAVPSSPGFGGTARGPTLHPISVVRKKPGTEWVHRSSAEGGLDWTGRVNE